ncbi:MAG: rane protein [Frankiales bacterium]|jgi:secretion/DNA translocation related TadE-like protein|nr:rane protein [Frankiales bacterium]
MRPRGVPVARSTRAGLLPDAGVATVLVLALAGVLALLGAGTASLAAVAVARQRAASAADLAALAAAERAAEGRPAACARARRVARLVDAELLTCSVAGEVVDLVVQVRPAGQLGRLGAASARARAGPPGGR